MTTPHKFRCLAAILTLTLALPPSGVRHGGAWHHFGQGAWHHLRPSIERRGDLEEELARAGLEEPPGKALPKTEPESRRRAKQVLIRDELLRFVWRLFAGGTLGALGIAPAVPQIFDATTQMCLFGLSAALMGQGYHLVVERLAQKRLVREVHKLLGDVEYLLTRQKELIPQAKISSGVLATRAHFRDGLLAQWPWETLAAIVKGVADEQYPGAPLPDLAIVEHLREAGIRPSYDRRLFWRMVRASRLAAVLGLTQDDVAALRAVLPPATGLEEGKKPTPITRRRWMRDMALDVGLRLLAGTVVGAASAGGAWKIQSDASDQRVSHILPEQRTLYQQRPEQRRSRLSAVVGAIGFVFGIFMPEPVRIPKLKSPFHNLAPQAGLNLPYGDSEMNSKLLPPPAGLEEVPWQQWALGIAFGFSVGVVGAIGGSVVAAAVGKPLDQRTAMAFGALLALGIYRGIRLVTQPRRAPQEMPLVELLATVELAEDMSTHSWLRVVPEYNGVERDQAQQWLDGWVGQHWDHVTGASVVWTEDLEELRSQLMQWADAPYHKSPLGKEALLEHLGDLAPEYGRVFQEPPQRLVRAARLAALLERGHLEQVRDILEYHEAAGLEESVGAEAIAAARERLVAWGKRSPERLPTSVEKPAIFSHEAIQDYLVQGDAEVPEFARQAQVAILVPAGTIHLFGVNFEDMDVLRRHVGIDIAEEDQAAVPGADGVVFKVHRDVLGLFQPQATPLRPGLVIHADRTPGIPVDPSSKTWSRYPRLRISEPSALRQYPPLLLATIALYPEWFATYQDLTEFSVVAVPFSVELDGKSHDFVALFV